MAPLKNSIKKKPTISKIPNDVLRADPGPSFLKLYGSFAYMMGCVVVATYWYHPWLKTKWDINDTSNEWKFVFFYAVYILACGAFYRFALAPVLGLQTYDVGVTSLHVVGASVLGSFGLVKINKMIGKPTDSLETHGKDQQMIVLQ